MIEMMMVLGIIGMVTMFAGEGFVSAAGDKQRQAVIQEVAAELRAARYLAMTQRHAVRVIFETDEHRILTEWADLPDSVFRRYEYATKSMRITRLSAGPSVVFYPSGRSATATTITLHEGKSTYSAMTVSLTGRVTIK
jgi:type IV fimbrial biogenesis protein FimT